MQSIHLGKKKIIEFTMNDMECIATLDNYTIDHFQKHNKKGLLRAMDEVRKDNVTVIIQLLGSMIREKKSNRILGINYLKQFDTFDILASLTPVLTELCPDNLPVASDNSEKK